MHTEQGCPLVAKKKSQSTLLIPSPRGKMIPEFKVISAFRKQTLQKTVKSLSEEHLETKQ